MVTGSFADGNWNHHGFVRAADGTIKTFDAPNAADTLPQSINDTGVVTGWYVVGGNAYHGFFRTP
jgi:hypothetical protein